MNNEDKLVALVQEVLDFHNEAVEELNDADCTTLKECTVNAFVNALAVTLASFCSCADCEAKKNNYRLVCGLLKERIAEAERATENNLH